MGELVNTRVQQPRRQAQPVAGTELGQWLTEACRERDLSWAEASRRADLFPGAISSFVRGTQPGLATCKKLADFFGVPVEFVLQIAGHSTRPPDALAPEIEEIVREITALPPHQRRALIALWRSLLNVITLSPDAPP